MYEIFAQKMSKPANLDTLDRAADNELMDPMDDSTLIEAARNAEKEEVEKALNEDLDLFNGIGDELELNVDTSGNVPITTSTLSNSTNTPSDTNSSIIIVDDSQNGAAALCTLNTSELNFSSDSSTDELSIEEILEVLSGNEWTDVQTQ